MAGKDPPFERAKTKTVLAGLAYHNQGGVIGVRSI